MKCKIYLIMNLILCYSILSSISFAQQARKQNILFRLQNNNYLGQQPPGMIPILFPPPDFQADSTWFWHGSPMFSPDLNEMYWAKYITQSNRTDIYFVKYENGQWTTPQRTSFSDSSYSDNNPFFLSSRDTLYFESSRPGGFIFKVTRTGGNWTQPVPISIPIPAGKNPGNQFSISGDRTIYSELWENNNTDLNLFRWRLVNGQYTNAEKLTGTINSPQFDFMPFIDPDEKFLVFCSKRNGGFGETDLYISYKTDSLNWTNPKNLDSLFNTNGDDVWPYISPDGLYFFFCSPGEYGFNPYWIDASILENYGAQPYLNENPPGNIPVLFAPSVMSNAYGVTFSPDGKELFYTKYDGQKNIIWHSKIVNYQWITHSIAFFSGNYDDLEPHISPDGQRLYFASLRPDSGSTPSDTMHGWFCEKTQQGWSEPHRLPEPLTNWDMMFITESNNRNLYFTSPKSGGGGGELYVATWNNGIYNTPARLSTQTINKFWHQAHPFIASDENYLIFDASVTDTSDTDLYISYRDTSGGWGDATIINGVNTSNHEGISFVSRNGKYFFFSRNGDLYWVDTQIIGNLYTSISRKARQNDYPDNFHLFQNYPNPFNPTTIINFQIPKLSFVKLTVFDVLGNEIEILVMEEMPKGRYKVDFNSTGLASGIYFYRLEAENFVRSHKMVLMK